MSLSSLLNGSIILQRKTSTQDPSLGETASWTNVASYNASIQPMSAKERLLFKQRGVTVSHYIYLDTDIGATYRDRVLDQETNKLYRVVNQFNMAGRDTAYRLEVLEMAG